MPTLETNSTAELSARCCDHSGSTTAELLDLNRASVLFDDAYKVVASLAFLLLFTCAVLAMPIFAAASLAIVVLSFPVAYAFYVGPLAISQLPVLAVISLYLVLGIGVDAIFIFCNSYALAEREARDMHAAAGCGGGGSGDDGPPTERRRWCACVCVSST